jgi:hypothetical protein
MFVLMGDLSAEEQAPRKSTQDSVWKMILVGMAD